MIGELGVTISMRVIPNNKVVDTDSSPHMLEILKLGFTFQSLT
jgi:hypothetical protein